MRRAIWQTLQKKRASSVAAPGGGLLDSLTAPLRGAWSLRRILSSYSGALIRVTNGTTTIDVGAVAGELDTAPILALSGNDAWVLQWYDQSPNGYHLNPLNSAAARNFIKQAGAIVTSNSKPAVRSLNAANDPFVIPQAAITGIVNATAITTYRQGTTIFGSGTALILSPSTDYTEPWSDNAYYSAFFGVGTTVAGYGQTRQLETNWREVSAADNNGRRFYKNENLIGRVQDGVAVISPPSNALFLFPNYGDMFGSQLVLLSGVLPTAERLALQLNIKTYYGTA
jgi:hypothetical protein